MAVTGIGGVFFKAKDPATLQAWYKKTLGIDIQDWGGVAFDWTNASGKQVGTTTALRITGNDDESFAPSSSPFMINFLVDNLASMLESLRADRIEIIGEFDEDEYGKFGWILDPEGNKIELWQPAAE